MLLREVATRYPQVRLNLNEELTGNLFEQLLYGRIDLALFTDAELPPEIAFTPLLEEDFYWLCAPADDPWPAGEVLDLEQAFARPLVWPGAAHGHCTRAIVERVAARHGVCAAPPALEVNSVHILKSAVQAGLGPTLMPLNLARRELEEGRLTAHRVDCPALYRTLGICVSTRMPPTPAREALAALIGEVVNRMGEQGQWPGSRRLSNGPT